MPGSFEGGHEAEGFRFGIVASRFNDEIVAGLLRGAVECLTRHGASDEAITIYRVPGAFEIPTVVATVAPSFDAMVAIGCLIRGETPHFEVLAHQVTQQLSRFSIEARVPVAFGVITCNTVEQAVERSSPGAGNKGWEAALAAIEMANLWRALRTRKT
jgi:6,7-dimethyl-8-ribityllumazine synthase